MWNVHNVYIMFIRIGIRKTRNTDDSLGSGTKLLLPSLSLGFRHEGREIQFFYADCWSSSALNSLTQPTCACTLQSTTWTGFAQVRKINSLRLSPNLNLPLLFKFTKNPSPSLPSMTSFTSPITFPIWCFDCDICDCHILPCERVNTCVNVCAYACTEPKGSKPN